MNSWTAIQARILSPLYYHGLYAPDGSATVPTVLTDTAMVFALAAIFNIRNSPARRSKPDYRADLAHVPWRASLFTSNNARLMAPVRHIIDVEREGGFTKTVQSNMGSGNFKKTFFVHEIACGATYQGGLLGPDPFEATGADTLIVRMGVGRTGIVELKRQHDLSEVTLNTATLSLFGHYMPFENRIIDTIRPSHPMAWGEAEKVLSECLHHV